MKRCDLEQKHLEDSWDRMHKERLKKEKAAYYYSEIIEVLEDLINETEKIGLSHQSDDLKISWENAVKLFKKLTKEI